MRNLTDEQIDLIAEDIRVRGVFSQSLQEDLLDHICCFIEEQDDERPFDEIYRLALDAFGQSGLQGVQDETLYLINRPYLTKMKKIAFVSAGLSAVALIGGAMFKIQHWPGANMMLIIGILVLAMFFIPYFFYVQMKEQTEKKAKVIAALGLVTAVLMALGALFKILHWPGAMVMLMAFIIFFLVFLPLYVINGARNPITRFSTVSNGLLFACIGGFMMLMSFQNPSKSVTDSLIAIHQKQENLLHSLQQNADGNPAQAKALQTFVTSCNAAVEQIPNAAEGEKTVGNGVPVGEEGLAQMNDQLKAALVKLNADLSTDSTWTPLVFEEIQPSLYGSVRFQVLQLETQAYVNAAK